MTQIRYCQFVTDGAAEGLQTLKGVTPPAGIPDCTHVWVTVGRLASKYRHADTTVPMALTMNPPSRCASSLRVSRRSDLDRTPLRRVTDERIEDETTASTQDLILSTDGKRRANLAPLAPLSRNVDHELGHG